MQSSVTVPAEVGRGRVGDCVFKPHSWGWAQHWDWKCFISTESSQVEFAHWYGWIYIQFNFIPRFSTDSVFIFTDYLVVYLIGCLWVLTISKLAVSISHNWILVWLPCFPPLFPLVKGQTNMVIERYSRLFGPSSPFCSSNTNLLYLTLTPCLFFLHFHQRYPLPPLKTRYYDLSIR